MDGISEPLGKQDLTQSITAVAVSLSKSLRQAEIVAVLIGLFLRLLRRRNIPAARIFGCTSSLGDRVKVLSRRSCKFSASTSSVRVALTVAAVFGFLAVTSQTRRWMAFAQSPGFEVASIKRNESGGGGRFIKPSGRRLSISNMTLKNLIMIAYQVRDFQISGGPAWIYSENYNIEAASEGDVTPKEMEGPMLRALLEDRFKLQVHRDTKELPIYVLTVGKNGTKLHPSTEKDCIPFDPANPPLPSAQGRNPSEMCGFIGLGQSALNAKQATMAALSMALSQLLSRTVVDKTGITGEVDAHLTFAPDDAANPAISSTDPALPSIFTAVQEQLGLKLESSKGPVEVLVIDLAERPSAN
jgi:uncharacterized protein (TIGR03435 family)